MTILPREVLTGVISPYYAVQQHQRVSARLQAPSLTYDQFADGARELHTGLAGVNFANYPSISIKQLLDLYDGLVAVVFETKISTWDSLPKRVQVFLDDDVSYIDDFVSQGLTCWLPEARAHSPLFGEAPYSTPVGIIKAKSDNLIKQLSAWRSDRVFTTTSIRQLVILSLYDLFRIARNKQHDPKGWKKQTGRLVVQPGYAYFDFNRAVDGRFLCLFADRSWSTFITFCKTSDPVSASGFGMTMRMPQPAS